jgi:hypothetical protein
MDEPLLAANDEEHEQQQQQLLLSAPPPWTAGCLPVAWTSIPADLNAPGKLLGSIGLEWM